MAIERRARAADSGVGSTGAIAAAAALVQEDERACGRGCAGTPQRPGYLLGEGREEERLRMGCAIVAASFR
jgi:hypothetical protein